MVDPVTAISAATAAFSLIKKGFDSKMGARPLARVIDNDIKTPLGRKLLFDTDNKGKVSVTVKEESLDLKWL